MPQLKHRLPSYRRHRASGQAVVTLGGRDIYLGPFGSESSRQRYEQVIAEWLASNRQPAPAARSNADAENAPQANLTVNELFLADRKVHGTSQSTAPAVRRGRRTHRVVWRDHGRPGAAVKICALASVGGDPLTLQDVYEHGLAVTILNKHGQSRRERVGRDAVAGGVAFCGTLTSLGRAIPVAMRGGT